MDLIDRVVPSFGVGELSVVVVKEHFVSQMNETASHFAAGKNIFAVKFADNDPEGHFTINHAGVVPFPKPQE